MSLTHIADTKSILIWVVRMSFDVFLLYVYHFNSERPTELSASIYDFEICTAIDIRHEGEDMTRK